MDFKTMSKQRKYVLIAAVVGIISMFLPWFSISMMGFTQSTNGMHDWGVLGFFCFVIAGLITLYGNQKQNIDKSLWMLTLILGTLPLLIVIVYYFKSSNSLMGTEFIGFGAYLCAIAAIALVASAFIFKSPTDSLKSGFDNLKKSVESKLANPGDSETPSTPGSTSQV